MALETFNWQNGSLVEPAKVEIDGVVHEVTEAQYEGETPLTAANLNQMQTKLLSNVVDNLDDDTKIPNVKAVKDIYSTDEIKTNKVWIDGKSIYRKVVILNDYGNLANNKIISVEINNIDTLTEEIYLYQYGTRPIKFPIVEANGNTLQASYDTVSKQIMFSGAGNWVNRTLTCIFEYTKTNN